MSTQEIPDRDELLEAVRKLPRADVIMPEDRVIRPYFGDNFYVYFLVLFFHPNETSFYNYEPYRLFGDKWAEFINTHGDLWNEARPALSDFYVWRNLIDIRHSHRDLYDAVELELKPETLDAIEVQLEKNLNAALKKIFDAMKLFGLQPELLCMRGTY
ncbi:MAG: hypothetical protein UT33_C0011G0057 [Candidatus Peregrinibacteria bacterium GW2011_GWC2_39_14]|nr:MAG: hypothetical protein UT33_C0011G0057 [Candidatus Peregrinibacteria bacterium GW2011_GWC2_39_14]